LVAQYARCTFGGPGISGIGKCLGRVASAAASPLRAGAFPGWYLHLFSPRAKRRRLQNFPLLPLSFPLQIANGELPFIAKVPVLGGVEGLPGVSIRRLFDGTRARIMDAEFREQSSVERHAEKNSLAISRLRAVLVVRCAWGSAAAQLE